ncbi:MAG: DUF5815 family protein [Halobacterium sp.]
MTEPRVPGGAADDVELPCGRALPLSTFDMGMREFDCPCGDTHAVVMDVHPPDRFLPEFLVAILRESIETTSDEMPEFGTPHLMGIVLEEFPGDVASVDASDQGDVGYALLWVTDFDSRRLHEVVVELVVELMEHAVSHADDDDVVRNFESEMLDFDVAEFVTQYRQERDFDAENARV